MKVEVWARYLGEHPGLSVEPQKVHIPVIRIMFYQQSPCPRNKNKIKRDLLSQSLKLNLNRIKVVVLTLEQFWSSWDI